ncbi:GNAT family N-acetyltransferase [Brevibacillus reuszeri]|uniref:GNAT family N-acetyltransferase n=1 Tax=Brevibacillus reuszeri TaxID=54915 RepID=UPI003D1B58BD
MDTASHVGLQHFTDQHIDALNRFELPEEQGQFTSLPEKVLGVTEGQYRIVITSDSVPVGFFLLHATQRVKEYTDNPNAMLLTSFSINFAEQGKGFAKKGLLLLPDFVHAEFPDCDEIALAVNHKNVPAQKLYLHTGFTDTGLRRMGAIGEQFIFRLAL